jgi:hypothetical protein
MSTKIYNGYYLDKCSLDELQSFTMSLRSNICELQKKLYATQFLADLTSIIDSKALFDAKLYRKENLPKNFSKICEDPYFHVYYDIMEKSSEIEKTNKRNPDYDFTCNMSIIPTPSKILVMFFSEQSEYTSLFESYPNVHPYPYFNNTDKPKDTSEEEWQQREIDWNPIHIPSMSGFTAQLSYPYLPFMNIFEMLSLSSPPSFNKRVNHHLSNIIFQQYFYQNKIKPDMYHIYTQLETAKEWASKNLIKHNIHRDVSATLKLKLIASDLEKRNI